MSRSTLLSKGSEHIGECIGWETLCGYGKVSYEWFVCSCSPIERNYQLQIRDSVYMDIKYCPCCGTPINSTVYDIAFNGRIA
jgi:hypothetical protein